MLLSDDPITEKDRGDRAWEDGMTDVVQPVVCDSQHKKVLGFLDEAKAAGTVGSTLPLARHFLRFSAIYTCTCHTVKFDLQAAGKRPS